ncbi:MAG: WYL domain-containing protein [Intrasporangium sp.]|uniref:helix-turn-helix transcriptional regulator n=1 Tax=Intrasporangium sp. TaxID=1925024 RepID=UPI0026498558|nr:WYL domain-containing protein [Intrasporangium sp.]MDN5794693.1 WYL domain-containing protein [Intrasporangium sp.]
MTTGRPVPETATRRLQRLLSMVPWLLAHPGVSIAAAALEFGVTEKQVDEDLSLLFVCGTPGGTHAELIDAQWDDGHIYLSNADDIAAPMRLTRDEAVTLTAGLHALVPSLVDPDVVERTLAKLRSASAELDAPALDLEIDDGRQHAAMEPIRAGLTGHRRLHLTYWVPSRDEATERDVDPMRVLNLDGHWYLEGWCHRADGVRLFRLDRIEAATVLPTDGTPPKQARPRDLDADRDVFVAGDGDLLVVIEADRDTAWIGDYYPTESVRRRSDGSVLVTMRVAEPALVRRLMLQLGGSAHVLEPTELARRIAAEARAALDAYDGSAGADGRDRVRDRA